MAKARPPAAMKAASRGMDVTTAMPECVEVLIVLEMLEVVALKVVAGKLVADRKTDVIVLFACSNASFVMGTWVEPLKQVD